MEDATSATINDGGDRDGGGPVHHGGDRPGEGGGQLPPTNTAVVVDDNQDTLTDKHQVYDDSMKACASLWVRRQVFEHSVAVPLIGKRMAKRIDFEKLAVALGRAGTAKEGSDGNVLAVSFEDWCEAARQFGGLESSELALVIVEALETNAPEAFAVVNGKDTYKSGRVVVEKLGIPVAELVAFLRLHAAAENSNMYHESIDIVWPEQEGQVGGAQDRSGGPSSPKENIWSSAAAPTVMPLNLESGTIRSGGGDASTSSAAEASTPASDSASASDSPARVAASPRAAASSSSASASAVVAPPSPSAIAEAATSAGAEAASQLPPPSPSSSTSSAGAFSPNPSSKKERHPYIQTASYQHSLVRETNLVLAQLPLLLKSIAATYNILAVTQESVEDLPIPAYVFEHLSFLLTASLSSCGEPNPISSVVPQWRNARDTNTTVPLRILVKIVSDALTGEGLNKPQLPIDLYEVSGIAHGTLISKSLPPITTTGNEPKGFASSSASADMNVEQGDRPQEAVAEQRRVSRSSVAKRRDVRIEGCIDAHIYWAMALGRVSFVNCSDCVVFVGACESLALIGCSKIKVHAVTRQIRIVHCIDIQSYLITRYRPHILGFTRGLSFAPYASIYAFFERDVAELGLEDAVQNNRWNEFFQPVWKIRTLDDGTVVPSTRESSASSVCSDEDDQAAFGSKLAHCLPPEKFQPFTIPVDTPDREFSSQSDSLLLDTGLVGVKGILPDEYKKVLTERRVTIERLQAEIKLAGEKLEVAMLERSKNRASSSSDTRSGTNGVRDEETNGGPSSSNQTSPSGEQGEGEEGQEDPNGRILRELEKRAEKLGLFQTVVEEKFVEWMVNSGNYSQVRDLCAIDPNEERWGDGSGPEDNVAQ